MATNADDQKKMVIPKTRKTLMLKVLVGGMCREVWFPDGATNGFMFARKGEIDTCNAIKNTLFLEDIAIDFL